MITPLWTADDLDVGAQRAGSRSATSAHRSPSAPSTRTCAASARVRGCPAAPAQPAPAGPPRGPGGRPGPGFAAGRLHYAAPTPVLSVPGMPRDIADITRACMAATGRAPGSSAVALSLWSILG
ncbi:hypothetical protein ACFQX7_00955, partial [Luedemannella flava]